MEPGHYTDPLEEALSHGAQRVAQVASLAAAAGQVALQRKALHDAIVAGPADSRAARTLRQQERALRQEATMTWASAHDPQWLARADLLRTARAWAGAAAFADSDASASSALRKCEDRLRRIHPYAMNRYDRLRAEGATVHEAMTAAAPLFSRAPYARAGDPATTRPALTNIPPGDDPGLAGDDPGTGPEPEQPGQAEQRAQQLASRLQARARAAGRPPLSPEELALVLETVTNLPETLIARVTGRSRGSGPAVARPAAAVAAECFPHGVTAAFRSPAVVGPGNAGKQAPARRAAAAVAQGVSHRDDKLTPGGRP